MSSLEVLARWNRWGGAQLEPGVRRDVTDRLGPFLDSEETVALSGPRRAGKTTVLYQVIDRLESAGVPREAILHVNLEEPALATDLGVDLLERAYRTFREEVHPTGRAYLLLDEVQRVPEWERWVRARTESEDLKVFVTGSSSALLSRELGSLLTGRHVTFQVLPLGFLEFLRFRCIDVPDRPELAGTPAPLQRALADYLRWGGFPQVVLAKEDIRRERLLQQYFDDVLFKDVALRHSVRDLPALRALAVHLLTHTASRMSYQRMAGALEVSLDMARSYASHLREAYVIELLSVFSRKTSIRTRNPPKVHAVDTGLRNAVCLATTPDRGHLAETAAWSAAARTDHDGIFYGRGEGDREIDLVVRQRGAVRWLIQVCASGDDHLPPRELAALTEAGHRFPEAQRVLVVDRAAAVGEEVEDMAVVPLWRFLAWPPTGVPAP